MSSTNSARTKWAANRATDDLRMQATTIDAESDSPLPAAATTYAADTNLSSSAPATVTVNGNGEMNGGRSPNRPRKNRSADSVDRSVKLQHSGHIAGRLMLGKTTSGGSSDDADLVCTYRTRHRIDHEEQSRGICCEVLVEECVPCCHFAEKRRHGWTWSLLLWLAWSAVSSEVFLYILHVSSIVLGAVKEGAS